MFLQLQKQRHQFEEDKKASLAKQESQHQEHLQEILLFQRRKLADQFDLALREKLVDERHGYMEQISTHLARLRGLELALEGKIDSPPSLSTLTVLTYCTIS